MAVRQGKCVDRKRDSVADRSSYRDAGAACDLRRYAFYLLYSYNGTNTDAQGAAVTGCRERSLMSLGASLRIRRAHSLQIWVLAILKDETLRAKHVLDALRSVVSRFAKFAAALSAHRLQALRPKP